jgi:hypothetical protein
MLLPWGKPANTIMKKRRGAKIASNEEVRLQLLDIAQQ